MRQGFTACQVLGGCFSSTTMDHMSTSRKLLFLHLPVTPTEPWSPASQDLSLAGCWQKWLAAHKVRILGPSRPLACWGKARSNMQHRRHIMAANAKPWLHPRSRRFIGDISEAPKLAAGCWFLSAPL